MGKPPIHAEKSCETQRASDTNEQQGDNPTRGQCHQPMREAYADTHFGGSFLNTPLPILGPSALCLVPVTVTAHV